MMARRSLLAAGIAGGLSLVGSDARAILRGSIQPDLFISAGQSNAGNGNELLAADLPTHLVASDSGIKIWNGSAFTTLINGTNNGITSWPSDPDSLGEWGPESEFLYQYRQKYPSKTVYLVRRAASGAWLSSSQAPDKIWDPTYHDATFGLFDQTTTLVQNAKAAILASTGIGPRVRGLLWMQGENDAILQSTADAYQTNLTAFIAAVRSSWGDANTRMLVGQIDTAHNRWQFGATVRAAQAAVVAADPLAGIVDTNSFPVQAGNTAHYDATGQVMLGGVGGMWSDYVNLGG